MFLKKRIFLVASLIISISNFSSIAEANHRWNLLNGIDPNPSDFKEIKVGKKIVYWHQRKIDDAIVELDYIVYQFDRESRSLTDVKGHWREDLPAFLPEVKITRGQAESTVKGQVQFSQLFIISPESGVFSPIKPTPKNPCWVVVSADEVNKIIITVVDAVKGMVLGYGCIPPYAGFSLSGPQYGSCDGWNWYWVDLRENAAYWFELMGYSTQQIDIPSEAEVQNHIQSKTTAMFYEIAHGYEEQFLSGCNEGINDWTTASEIEDRISGYTKMPFTFLASCEGMCATGDNTLSYEFRKGSTRNTATVGYCEMDTEKCLIDQEESCWSYALRWQNKLFEYMNEGNTVKEAFDLANADYAACFNPDQGRYCMRFAGDPNFAAVPVVPRVPPFPSLTIVDDVNDAGCIYPWNFFEENYLTYEICYDADGNSANDVIIIDQLPFEVDYYASDPNGTYDPNSHMVTWDIGNISAEDYNCIHLTVTVNYFAKPGSTFRNYCEIRNNQYSRNAIEKTKVCCWGPEIIYVDVNATGFNNGTSWQDAYIDLQNALISASNCDGKNTIWVAGGTYKPAKYTWQIFTAFQLVNDVAIYGGFPPGGGQRSPDIYETILSGDIDSDDTPDTDYVVTGADNAIIDGFTITKGYWAGLWCDGTSPTVRNCLITENGTGGFYGGGMYCVNSASPNLTNCIFSGNLAYYGGGLHSEYSSPNLTNCIIAYNNSNGIYGYNSQLIVSGCTIEDNVNKGIDCSSCDVIVHNCIIKNNNGEGIYNNNSSSAAITNNRISGNKSHGIYSYTAVEIEIKNNWIYGNGTGNSGDGIYIPNAWPAPAVIRNNTIVNNAGYGINSLWPEDANIINCILWGNNSGSDQLHSDNGTIENVRYSCIQNGDTNNGNINDDPLFYDDPNDPNNFHLSSNSPCIDEGDPNFAPEPDETDIDGEDRVVDGDSNGTQIVDIGADEYYWSPADFNGDEIVNFFDYARFANAWQSQPGDPNWDPNCNIGIPANNHIDYNDLAVFCEDWLWQAGWDKPAGFMMMGRSAGETETVAFTASETSSQFISAEQQIEKVSPLKIEQLIKWLEQVWLEEETHKLIDEDLWLKFIESLKKEL